MKFLLIFLSLVIFVFDVSSQLLPESIESTFTLQQERQKLKEGLYERTIEQTFSQSPDSSNEHRYQSAFWAIAQFMVTDSMVREGFRKTMAVYPRLETETRRSFMEALYTLNLVQYQPDMKKILVIEKNPKIFAMAALFIYRNEPGSGSRLLQQMQNSFPDYTSNIILTALKNYLEKYPGMVNEPLPDIISIFSNQRQKKIKTVYSFQRWNRDFPGLAIVQDADGRFVRDEEGKLVLIRQLARAGSNLPFFITNGNTPQGIYSIQGIGHSRNNFIGPTPNLQMIMPFEEDWKKYFQQPADSTNPLKSYLDLLPENWQSFLPMQEVFTAGKAGRTEIIAHGTTIDPMYFLEQPYFPISPTLGCLCAKEIWNSKTGKLDDSEQLKLINAFLKSPGDKGFLFVINLDNQQRSVSQAEIEKLVEKFEQAK